MSSGFFHAAFFLIFCSSWTTLKTMKYEIDKTDVFDKWLKKLRDRQAVMAIAKRLDRVILGNFGDVAPVGEGISEIRIFVGKGYRLYYVIHDNRIVILLCGGDKSTQKKDIARAKTLAKTIQEDL